MITPLTEMIAVKKLRLIIVMMKTTVAEAANPYIPHRFHFQIATTHTKFTIDKKPNHGTAHAG